jgi:hypothetical protein
MHAPLEFSPFTSRLVGVYKNPASSRFSGVHYQELS